MNILFIEPPASRRVGGIESALSGWKTALDDIGFTITRAETATVSELQSADVIHFHGLWERGHAQLRDVCRSIGKPYLVSPHGMLEPWAFRYKAWKKWPYFYLCEKAGLNRSARLVTTSTIEARHLHRWFLPEHISILPLGAADAPVRDHQECRRKLGWTDDERVLLFLSRCHSKKGLHLLIDAWPSVAKSTDQKLRLVIVGDGDAEYVSSLQSQTKRWPKQIRCDWIGAIWGDEKWDYLHAADTFCLPTFSENFGLAVLESLFAGTPVITTPETPWPEHSDKLPITITEPCVSDLTSTLTEWAEKQPETPEDRSATQLASRQLFSWKSLAPAYAALYESVAR